jgi:ATP-dependent helicase IRC3
MRLNTAHANRIARAISEGGGAAQAFHDGDIPRMSTTIPLRGGSMNTYERGSILAAFREARVRVLCCVQLLTEGFDLPSIGAVLLARPTMSTLLLTQMIGRGLRGPAVGGCRECHVVDFSDQLEIHRKRDAEARLRVARPSDAERFRRGEVGEQEAIPNGEA